MLDPESVENPSVQQEGSTVTSEAVEVERLEELMERLYEDDLVGVFFGGC